ncbi:hypothetical protein [Legionella brunensis]|uniref:Bile acid beta-glucosidase n=1 Tax=Legionella brunensis TaxID=29422 RepID=A0A0W0SET8_9GAMM|nr:hypothetical protein [Legionella brunensis]KTC81665.1 hypothetical protein Lbru_2185 [Legionella brunensis]
MKFKGDFENNYNRFWNSMIVPHYKSIKKYTPGHQGLFGINFGQSVDQYCTNVESMIDNLSRQIAAGLFTDQRYATRYLEETKKVAIADLHEFASKPFVNMIILAKIQNLLKKLTSGTAQVVAMDEETITQAPYTYTPGHAEMEFSSISFGKEPEFSVSESSDRDWRSLMEQFDEENPFLQLSSTHRSPCWDLDEQDPEAGFSPMS